MGSSRENLQRTLNHQQPDRMVVDFGASPVTGIHVLLVEKLRARIGESEADRKAKFNQLTELSLLLEVEADRTSMQSAIQELRDMLARESMRSRVAEKRLRELESTSAVRQARKLGLIKVPPYQFVGSTESKTKKRNRPHTIAVDMTPVLPGGENGGAKIFTIELLRALRVAAPENHFLLLTASRNHEELAMLDGPNMSRICVMTGKKETSRRLSAG